MRELFRPAILTLAITCLCFSWGCVSRYLMPKEDRVAVSRWASYEAARVDFEKIIPNKTTQKDLYKIGIDPRVLPNVTILDPLTIRNLFLGNNPAVRLESLPPHIQEYLQDLDNCAGFKYKQEDIKTKGEGNILLRLMSFWVEDITKGWQFEATVFLKKNNQVVVFALWQGNPNVDQIKKQIDPLGPLSKLFGSGRVIIADKISVP